MRGIQMIPAWTPTVVVFDSGTVDSMSGCHVAHVSWLAGMVEDGGVGGRIAWHLRCDGDRRWGRRDSEFSLQDDADARDRGSLFDPIAEAEQVEHVGRDEVTPIRWPPTTSASSGRAIPAAESASATSDRHRLFLSLDR